MACSNLCRHLLPWAAPVSAVFAGIGLIFSGCQIKDARDVNAAAVSTKLTTYATEEIRNFKEVGTDPERIISDLYVLQINRNYQTVEDAYYKLIGRRWCKAIAGNAVVCDFWNKNFSSFKDAEFRLFVTSILSGNLCGEPVRSDTCRQLKK